MKLRLLSFFIAALCPIMQAAPQNSPVKPLDLFQYFSKPEAWETDSSKFVMTKRDYKFKFLDDRRQQAVSVDRETLRFDDMEIYEARIFWTDSKISRVEVSVYNRGDAQKIIPEKEFTELIDNKIKSFDQKLGPGYTGKPYKPTPRMAVCNRRWERKFPLLQLEWAYIEAHKEKDHLGQSVKFPFTSEFIKITLVPKTNSPANDTAALTGQGFMAKATRPSATSLKANITHAANGDVYVDNIPMVDQGAKGYCVAASIERILRYYGHPIDEHRIAQIAATSAKNGTNNEGMSQALKEISKELNLERKELVKSDKSGNFQESGLYKDLCDYNYVAKKMKQDEIDWKDFREERGSGKIKVYTIDVNGIFKAIKPEILIDSRQRQKQAFEAFKRDIKNYTDQGIPVLWSCYVGLFPEVPDIGTNGVFGHMRLIIGYNPQKHEVLYSDSWGAAHVLKRMDENAAWAMTTGLYMVKPR